MHGNERRLRELGVARWKVAGTLTALLMFIYFGFIALIAYNREFLARSITRGLTIGILLGALVITASWILTWIYVRWANAHYDTEVGAMNE